MRLQTLIYILSGLAVLLAALLLLVLLRPKSDEGRTLRAEVLKTIDSQMVRFFWMHDFDRYRSAELAVVEHKLAKLLTSGTVSLMLSQDDSAVDFRDIVNSGKILLVDLSKLGSEVCGVLGRFTLSLLRLAAAGRGDSSTDARQPFHIYCDEAHRFVTDALEDLIAEARRYNVTLTLAHQHLSQFTARYTDVLSSLGSTIIFNVDARDAQHLQKDLRGLVGLRDLITLNVGQAIARIGRHVVRLETCAPLETKKEDCRDLIIARSREKYCRPTARVKEAIATRNQRWQERISEKTPKGEGHAGRQV